MSTLLERLAAMGPGENLDWGKIREEIYDEHDRATTTDERVTLLEIYGAVMDQVERSGMVQDMEGFKEARRQDYALLIAKESVVGENVCAEALDAITEREVAAGRMAANDPVRQGAVAAMTAPHYTRAELVTIEANRQVRNGSKNLAELEDRTSPVRGILRKHGWWIGIVIVAVIMGFSLSGTGLLK